MDGPDYMTFTETDPTTLAFNSTNATASLTGKPLLQTTFTDLGRLMIADARGVMQAVGVDRLDLVTTPETRFLQETGFLAAPWIRGVCNATSDPAAGTSLFSHKIWRNSASDLFNDEMVNDFVAQTIFELLAGP